MLKVRTCGNDPLGDLQLFNPFRGITPLLEVDVLNILPGEIVFSIGKGLQLFHHDVIHVKPILCQHWSPSRHPKCKRTACSKRSGKGGQ